MKIINSVIFVILVCSSVFSLAQTQQVKTSVANSSNAKPEIVFASLSTTEITAQKKLASYLIQVPQTEGLICFGRCREGGLDFCPGDSFCYLGRCCR